jgi:hypothetical protein
MLTRPDACATHRSEWLSYLFFAALIATTFLV